MKKSNLFFLVTMVSILCGGGFFCGCSSTDENKNIDPHTTKEVEDELDIKNDPKSCFERFRRAALQGNWKEAYDELNNKWQENQSLAQFTSNMQDVGRSMFKEPILSIYYSHEGDEPECHIITENLRGDKTIYRFLMQDGKWKMGGVKNVMKEDEEKAKEKEAS